MERMKTKNSKYLDPKENRKYYSQGDSNFMDINRATMAHKYIDRIAWLVEKVHELDSRTHVGVGVKDGYEILTLTARGVDSIGIDPSKDSIAEARLKANKLGYDGMEMFKVGFLEDLPDMDADTVSCLEVLEHVVDSDVALDRLAHLGRYVMVSTPDINGRHGMEDSERNEEHVRLYSLEELVEQCSKYGVVIEAVSRDDQLCVCFESKFF